MLFNVVFWLLGFTCFFVYSRNNLAHFGATSVAVVSLFVIAVLLVSFAVVEKTFGINSFEDPAVSVVLSASVTGILAGNSFDRVKEWAVSFFVK